MGMRRTTVAAAAGGGGATPVSRMTFLYRRKRRRWQAANDVTIFWHRRRHIGLLDAYHHRRGCTRNVDDYIMFV